MTYSIQKNAHNYFSTAHNLPELNDDINSYFQDDGGWWRETETEKDERAWEYYNRQTPAEAPLCGSFPRPLPATTIPPASILISTQRKLPLPKGLLLHCSDSLCDLLPYRLVQCSYLFILLPVSKSIHASFPYLRIPSLHIDVHQTPVPSFTTILHNQEESQTRRQQIYR